MGQALHQHWVSILHLVVVLNLHSSQSLSLVLWQGSIYGKVASQRGWLGAMSRQWVIFGIGCAMCSACTASTMFPWRWQGLYWPLSKENCLGGDGQGLQSTGPPSPWNRFGVGLPLPQAPEHFQRSQPCNLGSWWQARPPSRQPRSSMQRLSEHHFRARCYVGIGSGCYPSGLGGCPYAKAIMAAAWESQKPYGLIFPSFQGLLPPKSVL